MEENARPQSRQEVASLDAEQHTIAQTEETTRRLCPQPAACDRLPCFYYSGK